MSSLPIAAFSAGLCFIPDAMRLADTRFAWLLARES
jgi:hypothetical protein